MLSLHGLVVVASDILEIKHTSDSYCVIKVEIASPNYKNDMLRFNLSVGVPIKDLEEAKIKLEQGKVIEIMHGSLNALPSKLTNNPLYKSYLIEVQVEYKYLKGLVVPFYYDQIKDFTIKGE